jgi:hypothetical protein
MGMALVLALAMGGVQPARAEDLTGVALDPDERTYTLAERRCGDAGAERPCSELATALGRRPGHTVHGFDEVTDELPARLRSDCDVKPDDVGWPTRWIRCFDAADTGQREWLTQGIGGTDEWRTSETPGGDDHFLVATWCWRGTEGFAATDFCDADEPVKRTRISLIDVGRNAYRNVELVEPYLDRAGGETVVASRGILLHAGGAAIAGRWLYVADTDRIYVFNLRHFVREGDGPYRLPVWARYETADDRDREEHNAFSSISIDGSGEEPSLVAAEWRLNPGSEALVTVWPLQPDGQLPPADPTIRSRRAWMIDGDSIIDHVQGVVAAGDLFLFSESSNRIERTPAGTARRRDDMCIEWGAGTGEDLYASERRDVVVGINESSPRTRSAFWAVSYRHAFDRAPPPEGYPRRDC